MKLSVYFLFIFSCSSISLSSNHSKFYPMLRENISAIKAKDYHRADFDNIPIEEFTSKGYLLCYRAKKVLMELPPPPLGDNLKKIQLAHIDVNQALSSKFKDKKLCEGLLLDIRRRLIVEYFNLEKYYEVIETTYKLPPQDLKKRKWILYFGISLFRTKQITAFKRLARANPGIFLDYPKVKQTLGFVPQWERALANLKIKLNNSVKTERAVETRKEVDFLNKPEKSLIIFHRSKFLGSEYLFKKATTLYFNIINKNKISEVERKYKNSFDTLRPKLRSKYLSILFYKFWKKNLLKEAEDTATVYVNNYKGGSSTLKILYDLARVKEEQRKFVEASRGFSEIAEITDKMPYVEYANFRKAWTLLLADKIKEALNGFREYLKKYPEGRYASTSFFYSINLSESLKKSTKEDNQMAVESFIKDHPLNFYSVKYLTEGRVSKKQFLSQLSQKVNLILSKPRGFFLGIEDVGKTKVFFELRDLGLVNEARDLFKTIEFDKNNREYMMFLIFAFDSIKDYFHKTIFLTKAVNNFPEFRHLINWGSLYPQHLLEDIIKVKKRLSSVNINKYFILSIIRQESAFYPKAISSANAQGLMQLISSTAKRSARSLGLKTYDITNSSDNILLGTKTVVDLFKKYPSRLDFVLSAYNAGPKITDQWISSKGDLQPLEFIESIPYQETRSYIKNVLRNFVIYSLLYESKEKLPSLFFFNVQDKLN